MGLIGWDTIESFVVNTEMSFMVQGLPIGAVRDVYGEWVPYYNRWHLRGILKSIEVEKCQSMPTLVRQVTVELESREARR